MAYGKSLIKHKSHGLIVSRNGLDLINKVNGKNVNAFIPCDGKTKGENMGFHKISFGNRVSPSRNKKMTKGRNVQKQYVSKALGYDVTTQTAVIRPARVINHRKYDSLY